MKKRAFQFYLRDFTCEMLCDFSIPAIAKAGSILINEILKNNSGAVALVKCLHEQSSGCMNCQKNEQNADILNEKENGKTSFRNVKVS